MQRNTTHILWIGWMGGFISTLYFLSLIVHLPFPVTAGLILICSFFSLKWLGKITTDQIPVAAPYKSGISFVVMILLLTGATVIMSRKYGDWDAVCIWNYLAKNLVYPEYWHHLFENHTEIGNPNYPYYLPGTIAFFWRLTGISQAVPFLVSFIFMLAVPVLLFLELYKKQFFAAVVVAGLLILNPDYINQGLNQFADTPLAFFFLGSILCMKGFNDNGDSRNLLLCGAMLGCSIWTKNEGILFFLVFVLFHWKTLSGRSVRPAFLKGLAPFLFTWLIFKIIYAPVNQVMQTINRETIHLLLDKSRYKAIFGHLMMLFGTTFSALKYTLIGYLVLLLISKKMPDKNLLMLLLVLAGYCGVYLITPLFSLTWNLNTSMSRLLQQLMPAMLFVCFDACARFSAPLVSGYSLRKKKHDDSHPLP